MREIKFRAWDKGNQEMVYSDKQLEDDYYVFTVTNDGVCVEAPHYDPQSCTTHYLPVESEIMQYTGLKDRNGKEIYEGDFIRGHYGARGEIQEGPVYWCDEHLAWSHFGPLHAFDQRPSRAPDILILGNIYENPELLEK